MKLEGKKVLVTGADGFIGSHLTERLVRCGADARAFVLYNSFNSWGWLDTVPEEIRGELDVIAGDIRDPHGVKKALVNVDVVFHLAALIGIPYSYHSPDTYIDTNVKGMLNVLQAARELDTEKVVHTSTSEVYGTAQFVPITEDHPLQPQSPYSASKTGADQLAMSFYHAFGTPVAIIRPFNTFGPRQSARAVIPSIIIQALSKTGKIQLGALSPTRDFNYVDDMAGAFIAVAESDKAVGTILNAGTGFEISINDLAQTIFRLIDRELEIETDKERIRPENSEIDRLCASNAKIQNLTGWQPMFSGLGGLEAGLRETIKWFSEPDNLRKYKSERYNI